MGTGTIAAAQHHRELSAVRVARWLSQAVPYPGLMVRRTQQAKQDERRVARHSEEARRTGEVHGKYVPPPRSTCTEKVFYLPLDDDATFQVEQRTWTDSRLVDFHLTASAMRLAKSGWDTVDLVRADICHGHAHAHLLVGQHKDSDPLHIKRIDTVDDVQPAFRTATIQIIGLAARVGNERGNGDD